jgi:hypothetical protein
MSPVAPQIRGGLLFRIGSNLRAIEEHFRLALFARALVVQNFEW